MSAPDNPAAEVTPEVRAVRVGFRYRDGEVLSPEREALSEDVELPVAVLDLGDGEWLTLAELRGLHAALDAAEARCGICEDHARVQALIEASSLGTPEAKAARESVPNEVGIAIARAAEYLRRAEAAEQRLAAVRRLLRYEYVSALDLRAALGDADGGGAR